MLTDEMIEALKEYYLAKRFKMQNLIPARMESTEPCWWDK